MEMALNYLDGKEVPTEIYIPFEAFSNYRTVDAYLRKTAQRIVNLSSGQQEDAIAEALTKS